MSETSTAAFWTRVAAFRDTLSNEEQAWINGLVQAAYRQASEVQGYAGGYYLPLPPPPPILGFGLPRSGLGEPGTVFDPNQPYT